MDEAICTALTAALAVIQDPTSTAEERRVADVYCNEIKEKNANCHLYGLYLAQPGNSDYIRFFGLHLLEHVCKYKWNGLSGDTKVQIKVSALDLISKATDSVEGGPLFVNEKIAGVISEIVKREWPQHWPELFPRLGEAAQMAPIQLELVLLVLRTVSEDVGLYGDETSDRRKRDVTRGLKEAAPALYTFFFQTLATQYQSLKAAGGTVTAETQMSRRVVVAALRAFCAFADFVPPPLAFRPTANLVEACTAMLVERDDEMRMAACECLLMLFSKKAKAPDAQECYTTITPVLVERAAVALADSADAAASEVEYRFQKRVCQLLNEVGTLHMYALDNQPEPTSHRVQHASLMLALLGHPSLMLSSFTLNFWLFVCRAYKQHEAWLDPILVNLLQALVEKHSKFGDPDQHGTPAGGLASSYSVVDFEDHDEWVNHYAIVKNRVIELVRSLGRARPLVGLEVATQCLAKVLGDVQTQLNGTPAQTGLTGGEDPLPARSFSYLQLDGALSFIECVVGGAMSAVEKPKKGRAGPTEELSDDEKAAIGTMIEQLLTPLYNGMSDTTSPNLLMRRMGTIATFTPFFRYRPDAIPMVMDKILTVTTLRLPAEQGKELFIEDLSVETSAVRRKACDSFLAMCKELKEKVLPYLEQLATTVKRLSEEGSVRIQERVMLIEAVVYVANELHNYEQQTNIMLSVAGPIINEWSTNPDIQRVFSSPQNLLQLVTAVPAGLEEISTKEKLRSRKLDEAGRLRVLTSGLLMASVGCLKKVSTPDDWRRLIEGGFVDPQVAGSLGVDLTRYRKMTATHPHLADKWEAKHIKREPFVAQLIASVLPTTLHFIRSLHGLWNPELRSTVRADFQSVFDISTRDRDYLLGFVKKDQGGSALPTPAKEHWLRAIGLWLSTMRDQSYQFIGLLCASSGELFNTEGAVVAVLNAALSDITSMQNRHVRSLLKSVISSLLLYAPDTVVVEVMDHLLPPLMSHVYTRLEMGWAAGQDTTPTTSTKDNDRNEILADRALRDVTREYLDLLYRILRPTTATDDEVSQYESGSVGGFDVEGNSQGDVDAPSSPIKPAAAFDAQGLPLLCSHALTTEAIIVPLLQTSNACLASIPDSATGKKATQLCTRAALLLLSLGDNANLPSLFQAIAHDMLSACVSALMQSHQQDNTAEILGLITIIYTGFSDRALPLLHDALIQSTPAGLVTPEKLAELDQSLARHRSKHQSLAPIMLSAAMSTNAAVRLATQTATQAGGRGVSHALRKQRGLFKTLLQDVLLAAAPPRQFRRPANILNLPESMYIIPSAQRRPEGAEAAEEGESLHLESLFGLPTGDET